MFCFLFLTYKLKFYANYILLHNSTNKYIVLFYSNKKITVCLIYYFLKKKNNNNKKLVKLIYDLVFISIYIQ